MQKRKQLRLKNYDYSSMGYYFVTVCTQNQHHYFNNHDINNMIQQTWFELKQKYQHIMLDEFVVMPNHIHGIIGIVGADLCVRPQSGSTHRSTPTLGEMIRWFKTMTTNYYINGVNKSGWTPFFGKIWQRNYYERIIRDDRELNNIRQYIRNNPLTWESDENYTKQGGRKGHPY